MERLAKEQTGLLDKLQVALDHEAAARERYSREVWHVVDGWYTYLNNALHGNGPMIDWPGVNWVLADIKRFLDGGK